MTAPHDRSVDPASTLMPERFGCLPLAWGLAFIALSAWSLTTTPPTGGREAAYVALGFGVGGVLLVAWEAFRRWRRISLRARGDRVDVLRRGATLGSFARDRIVPQGRMKNLSDTVRGTIVALLVGGVGVLMVLVEPRLHGLGAAVIALGAVSLASFTYASRWLRMIDVPAPAGRGTMTMYLRRADVSVLFDGSGATAPSRGRDPALDEPKAAPADAVALARMADEVSRKIYTVAGDEAQRLWLQAYGLAQDALDRDDNEDRAVTVLGRLALLRQGSTQARGPEASRAIAAGDALFAQERFHEAQRAYEEACRAQPELAAPVKLAGNCQFRLSRYPAAEQWFRRAVELDPHDPQAHHFLADACTRQGNLAGAWAAAVASIAANPAYCPAWQVVRAIRTSQGRRLRRFRIRPGASVSMKDKTITMHGQVEPAEMSAWLAYSAAKAGLLGTGASPLAVELGGLRAAAQLVLEAPPREPLTEGLIVLRHLHAMDRQGDLEIAILLLAYDEVYRDDLEALERRRPNVCAEFLERYDLRP